LIVHFWRIRKDGFSAAPIDNEPPQQKIETWPNLVVREYMGAILMLIFLVGWSLLMNAPLEGIADPTVTPNPSKAPWYFLGLQELLVYFDPWIAGVLLPGLITMGLIAIPYLDPDPNRGVGFYSVKERPFASSIFLTGIGAWFTLIVIGTFLRGPNWQWYWPWESWLIHKAPPPPTSSLPLAVGVVMLLVYFGVGMVLPLLLKLNVDIRKTTWKIIGASLLLALIIGVLPSFTLIQGLWVGFGVALYSILGVLLPQQYLRGISGIRYVVCMGLLLMMIGVFLKMSLHLGFNIKYVVALPQVNFNI